MAAISGTLKLCDDPGTSSGWLKQRGSRLNAGTHGAQPGHEFFSRAHELFYRHGRQAVHDKPLIGAARCQRGPFALPPVPAAAGDAVIVAPDHLARFSIFDDGSAVANGVKRFRAYSGQQSRNTLVAIGVLATQRGSEAKAEGVVKIHQWIDGGQGTGLADSFPQCLDRTRSFLRIGAEAAESRSPGFEMSLHPNRWRKRNDRKRRGSRMKVPHRHAEGTILRILAPNCGGDNGREGARHGSYQ